MIKECLNFIEKSPTPFHVVENIRKMLIENGFIELLGNELKLEKGKNYFKVRNDSSIVAFKIPNKEFSTFRIVTSHSDSPCYKIKANPCVYKHEYTLLNVAPYGGMIHSTFFDRPLKVAGRVFYFDSEENLKSKFVSLDNTPVMIPNLAIHFNRDINSGHQYKASKEISPILSLGKINLLDLIKEKESIEGEIVTHDLFVCSNEKGYIWGTAQEFMSTPRLDDLECVYGSFKALLESNHNEISMGVVFTNEEVGSNSYAGANSDFLSTVFAKIKDDFNINNSKFYEMINSSLAIHTDNAHTLHPNYPEVYDLDNSTIINNGIIIKFSPHQNYTTDGGTAGKFIELCRKCRVKYQLFENHSDVRGGSTLGNILNQQISIPSLDVGVGQFAMHSAFETAGTKDFEELVKVLKAHFES